ncbi:MAG TPA: glycosyltransferase, partial [Parasegetibacter sp.]
MKRKKKIAVSVMSDLVTDQRVLKTCHTLRAMGYEIEVFCISGNSGISMEGIPFKLNTIHLSFNKGIWRFIQFNVRLYFRLRRSDADIFWANDLDALLPNTLVSQTRKKELIYDSHELYTEQPSLYNRRFKKKLWERVERFCMRRLNYMVTVNQSISSWYKEKYGIEPAVVRNVPLRSVTSAISPKNTVQDNQLNGNRILILQGHGIHRNRGGLEIVEAMQFLDSSFLLYIVGGGNAMPDIIKRIGELKLDDRVKIFPRMPYKDMMTLTASADLGLQMEKVELGPGSLHTLPNKLFDYMHAGIPVLSSPVAEGSRIIRTYDFGLIIEKVDPKEIARGVIDAFSDISRFNRWKENAKSAALHFCWEKESEVITDLMNRV